MKRIKIKLGEEFEFNGWIYHFTDQDGPIKLKRLKEAGKSKEVEQPTLEEVVWFFKSKGFPEKLGTEFYEYYSVADWKDGKGNVVKNYKQKALAVWMKENRKEQVGKQKTETSPVKGGFGF